MDQIKIGEFISSRRKVINLTQSQLAEKLNISKNAISKWERGINLPDVSIMQELCSILDISLNELFAGEKLNDQQIIVQSEKTIIDILNIDKARKNKNKIIAVFMIVILIILFYYIFNLFMIDSGYKINPDLKYNSVYKIGYKNIEGNFDKDEFEIISVDFEIGANKYGEAVFKDPKKAFDRLKKDYSLGINAIQNEFDLDPINNFNFRYYKNYAFQLVKASEEEKRQAIFVGKFLDIYENSFNY